MNGCIHREGGRHDVVAHGAVFRSLSRAFAIRAVIGCTVPLIVSHPLLVPERIERESEIK